MPHVIINLNPNKMGKVERKENVYMCPECRTTYHTPEDKAPPGIKWSDGHQCTPEKVEEHEEANNALLRRRSGQYSDTVQNFV